MLLLTNVASVLVSLLVGEGFPGISDGKASVCNAGDLGSILGSGRFPGGGNDSPLQYSCLENPIDRGAGVTKCQMRLSD